VSEPFVPLVVLRADLFVRALVTVLLVPVEPVEPVEPVVPLPRMIVRFVCELPTPDAAFTPMLPAAALRTLPERIEPAFAVMTFALPDVVCETVPVEPESAARMGLPVAAIIAAVPKMDIR
jgi:hypothetical protein